MAPVLPERFGAVTVHARYLPAEGARSGGDFYDVVESAYGVRAIIGDVTGHGTPASGLAGQVRRAFRLLAAHEPKLPGIARRLDAFVAERRDPSCECFVSAALVQLGAAAADAQLLVCGHPAPLLVSRGGAGPLGVLETALPLGLRHLDPGGLTPSPFVFGGGDALLLYTDGAIEARDSAGRLFPFAEHAARLACERPPVLLTLLEGALLGHSGGVPEDDIALLCLRAEHAEHSERPVPAMRPAARPAARRRGPSS